MAICEICTRGPAPEHGGVTVFRQNAKGEPGIWRCAAHNHAPVDPEVAEIVSIIEGGGDTRPPRHEDQERQTLARGGNQADLQTVVPHRKAGDK